MKDFRLYVIIDTKSCKGRSPVLVAKEAIAGGADAIQLRDKEAGARKFMELGRRIRGLTAKNKTLFIINDRADVSKAVGADGVHLGQDDLTISAARSILGKKKIIGLSTHTLSQAREAEARGADYIGVGPIYATPTKPEYKPVGVGLIKEVSGKIRIPFVAIGGIDEENIEEVLAAGATRIAVVRAVCGAEDVSYAARTLKERLIMR